MKKILATLLTIISIMNLALPQFVAAEAGTENYIIDECDFENGTGNWQVTTTDGISHGVEKFDDMHGLSYKITVPAGEDLSTSFAYAKKADAFEHGEVTIEADFRYNTAFANINLFAVRNDNGAEDYVPSLMYMDKINGNEVAIHQWHHIKYVMNMEDNYSYTYIDDVLVASDDNATGLESFGDVRINLTPTGTTSVIFYIDNITIKQTQNTITETDRAVVSSYEFYNLSGASYGVGKTDVTEDVFCAEITMSRSIRALPLRNRAVKATINGVPTDVYAYGEGIATSHDFRNGWDNDYVDTFTVYFSEKPAPGSTVVLDLTELYDTKGRKVKEEDCVIAVTVEGEAETDVRWSLRKEDGNVVRTVTQLSDGDKVQAVANITANTELVGKSALLVLAAYNGNEMTDMVTADVTIPSGSGELTTDYLTVAKTSDYTIKEMLILKENITPVTDANVVSSIYEEDASDVKNEMNASLSAFTKYTDSSYESPYTLQKIDYAASKAFFADTICLVADSNFFWGLDSKYRVKDKVIWVDEDLYASVSMLNSIFGTKTYTFSRQINGKEYVSVMRAANEVLNLHASISDHGIVVVSNRKFNIANEINKVTVDNMIRYITGERPTVEMLKEATKDLVHPYLLPMDKLAEIKQKILDGDEELKQISDAVIKQASASFNMTPFAEQKAGYYYGMVSDDVLNNYWAYYMTGKEEYATKIVNAAVEMSTWNHYWGGTFYLQASKACNAMAYAYDLFYDKFTTAQKTAIATKISRWGIYQARTYMQNGGWPHRENNWNTYNNAGLIISCLAVREDALGLMDENDYESNAEYVYEIFAEAIHGLEFQQQMWGPNGGAMEGLSYFTMIVSKYTEALTTLEAAVGTDYSLSAVPGFLASGNGGAYQHSSKGTIGLSESSSSGRTVNSNSAYMAYKLGDINMQRRRLHLVIMPGAAYSLQDLIWYMEDDNADRYAVDMPLDINYSHSEIASSRSEWSDNATFLALHAGQNDFSHFQFDAGTFVFQSGGVEFAADPGSEAYKTTYENGGEEGSRNRYYAARAEGQNVYVVNPGDAPGQEYHAYTEIETVAAKPNGVIYSVDLTPAYIGQVKQAKRGFMLTEGRKVFVLQDEIKPKSKSDDYYWFWHTKAAMTVEGATTSEETVTKADGEVVTNTIQETTAAKSHRVRLTKDFKSVDLYFESNVDFTISAGLNKSLETSPTKDKDDSDLVQSTLYSMNKITANFTANADEVLFRVTAVPVGTGYTRPKLGKMSGWTVEDGIMSVEYTIGVDSISDVPYGITVDEFLSNVFVEKTKKVTLNGNEVTTGTLKAGMKLVADGRTLNIEYISSGAQAETSKYTVAGYEENASVDRMLEELAIVLGDGITASENEGSVFDGMTVTANDRTYTVRTGSSYVMNAITNVLEDTPSGVIINDLKNILGDATAESDKAYNGMKIKCSDGRIYTVKTIAPAYEYNFNSSTTVLDASVVRKGYYDTDFGVGVVYVGVSNNSDGTAGGAQTGVELKADVSDRGNKALHLTSDGSATNDVQFQLMNLSEGMTDGKYKIEFKYKTDTDSGELRFTQNYAGDGNVIGQGFQPHFFTYFRDGGSIYFGNPSYAENYNVGMWEPDEWYHVEIELNPVEDWRFKLRINDRVVAEGHHPSFLQPMTRLQIQMIAQAGEEASIWLDDVRFTRIYG